MSQIWGIFELTTNAPRCKKGFVKSSNQQQTTNKAASLLSAIPKMATATYRGHEDAVKNEISETQFWAVSFFVHLFRRYSNRQHDGGGVVKRLMHTRFGCCSAITYPQSRNSTTQLSNDFLCSFCFILWFQHCCVNQLYGGIDAQQK